MLGAFVSCNGRLGVTLANEHRPSKDVECVGINVDDPFENKP